MLKKHATLSLLLLALLLLVIATLNYPGGSQVDKNSIGYSWANNYVSNLFGEKAVNGMHNPARFWAVGGMVFLSAGLAWFFLEFSRRIPQRGAANVIKYIGAGGMVFTFLIATPLHDVMITISATMFLIGMFYITVFVLRSKRHLFKVLCIIGLLIFYATLYMYGMHQVQYLPIMQKICFASTLALVWGLEYCTGSKDFQQLKK